MSVRAHWIGSWRAGVVLGALMLIMWAEVVAGSSFLTARMVQHLLLAQLIPPLLIAALPVVPLQRALRHRGGTVLEQLARRPMIGWSAGIAALLVWHWPPLSQLSMATAAGVQLHHASVLLAGFLFWWPIATPLRELRLGVFRTVAYLASACLVSSVVGMHLVFAPSPLYATMHADAAPAIATALRAGGMTPLMDQRIAGLMMWIPCCIAYACAVAVMMTRWYANVDAADAATHVLQSAERR